MEVWHVKVFVTILIVIVTITPFAITSDRHNWQAFNTSSDVRTGNNFTDLIAHGESKQEWSVIPLSKVVDSFLTVINIDFGKRLNNSKAALCRFSELRKLWHNFHVEVANDFLFASFKRIATKKIRLHHILVTLNILSIVENFCAIPVFCVPQFKDRLTARTASNEVRVTAIGKTATKTLKSIEGEWCNVIQIARLWEKRVQIIILETTHHVTRICIGNRNKVSATIILIFHDPFVTNHANQCHRVESIHYLFVNLETLIDEKFSELSSLIASAIIGDTITISLKTSPIHFEFWNRGKTTARNLAVICVTLVHAARFADFHRTLEDGHVERNISSVILLPKFRYTNAIRPNCATKEACKIAIDAILFKHVFLIGEVSPKGVWSVFKHKINNFIVCKVMAASFKLCFPCCCSHFRHII